MPKMIINIPKRIYNHILKTNAIVDSDRLEIKDAILEGEIVPSGKWIKHEANFGNGVIKAHRECSNCGTWFVWDMPRNSFCPNCGAKMVEEQTGENE